MKQRTKALFILITIPIVGVITMSFFKPQQQAPQPKFTVTLTGNEWQTVINAITQPDDFSNNQKKQVSELITRNIVAVDTTKKK